MPAFRSRIALQLIALATVSIGCLAGSVTAQPPLAPAESDAASASPNACIALVDQPLTSLSVDIRPRDRDGVLVATADLPTNCWAASGREGLPIWLEVAPICAWWDCNCLLAFARFCHQPLYFEDPALERCGDDRCLPQLCSMRHFLCDVALLPARLIVRPPRTRMCTPTPHCCAPLP